MMDPQLTQALKAAPTNEYLLQGSILDSSLEVLLCRLKGLCDHADSPEEKFVDHEMVYAIKNASIPQPLQYSVRHSLVQPENWQLRYLGHSEMGDKSRHTLIRNCVDVATSDNVLQFLHEVGFRLDHEFVVKGFYFHKGRMKVTVSKIFKMMQQGHTTDNLESIVPSYLVELSVLAMSGQDAIAEDMKNFAEQLKPLVQLEKIDHRRLQATGT
ncbi:mediator of RNA polymerase II transcription subunit 18-like [Mytilus californianus]|uniref:mediator of RNA polymerase II transcription subunit 18-like n=1 Tax=Mytilus californianus TaxID=6549 RepID=UPI002245F2FA|nr:mediator of RNA polymerase II transcription subunit 18-like [Mytilus californianus]XP_052066042.1 mediator of RNA polymerase II transcription subunit 18-like [Mytilus californianus]XP_052066043.1 mediator of RNA polymerase II transcription subunit 18-like [Mytilus californianus]